MREQTKNTLSELLVGLFIAGGLLSFFALGAYVGYKESESARNYISQQHSNNQRIETVKYANQHKSN